MQTSLFINFVKQFFPKLEPLVEKVNGKRNGQLTYLWKTMLRREYSADQKWESASVNTNYVAADIVAMDSPLPPKKRDAIAHSNGELPKIGMKKILRETQINAINIMIARGASFANVARKLVDDSVACSNGIDEKLEYCFLTALSDGYILVEDENNAGSGIRVNFNFMPENSFGVETKGQVELDDIERVLNAADQRGDTITQIAIAKSTYNKLRATRGAKELAANYKGQVYTPSTALPTPTATVFDEAFADQYGGVTFLKIDRSVKIEKNGHQKNVKPFNPDKLTFLTSNEVGAMVYSTLAESTNPVQGVEYSTIDGFKLISKYSKTDPLQEFTAGQALALPVLENIDQIYSLDIQTAQEVDTSAEGADAQDTYTTIGGVKYAKAGIIGVLKGLGAQVRSNSSDETLIKAYNVLSEADKAAFAEQAAAYVAV